MAIFWAFNPSILADGETTNYRRLYSSQTSGNGTVGTYDGEKGISSITLYRRTTDITTWPAANWATGWAVFRWRQSSAATERVAFQIHNSTGSTHFSINANTSGSFDIVDANGSDVATAQGAWSVNTWYTFAVQWTINGTTGAISFWLNGSLIYAGTNLDTQNGGTADAPRIGFGSNVSESIVGWCILGDTTGSIATGYDNSKTYRVAVLYPDGAGNSTQWTPTAGSNYQTVDETEYSAADYNSSNTNTHKDTFTMTAMPAGVVSILAVVPWSTADMDDATARSLNTVVRHSTTEGVSADRSLVNGNIRQVHGVHETNPSTSAQWSESEVNAMEVGYELSM